VVARPRRRVCRRSRQRGGEVRLRRRRLRGRRPRRHGRRRHRQRAHRRLVRALLPLDLPARSRREAHFGLGGTTRIAESESGDYRRVDNVIWPTVGFIGGAHFFPVHFFSIDLGLGFDYLAPHGRFEQDAPTPDQQDWDQTANVFNLAVQVGMSVWFG
jgi:hypothetical protein